MRAAGELTRREFAEVVQVWTGVLRLARRHGLTAKWDAREARRARSQRGTAIAQRGQVVAERRDGTAQAKVQAPDLRQPPIDYEALARKPFLTVRESMAYLSGFTSAHAFRQWVHRNGVPKARVGRSLRFRRRDLDRAVNAQPSGDPRHG
jgi:hypothetical protein